MKRLKMAFIMFHCKVMSYKEKFFKVWKLLTSVKIIFIFNLLKII